MVQGTQTFEEVRNSVRASLHNEKPDSFPRGTRGSNSNNVLMECFKSGGTFARNFYQCPVCLHEIDRRIKVGGTYNDRVYHMATHQPVYQVENYSLSGMFGFNNGTDSNFPCPKCAELTQAHTMHEIIKVSKVPSMLIFALSEGVRQYLIAPYIKIPFEGKSFTLKLRGVIYGGEGHFTSRIISPEGTIWFHDGMTTASACKKVGSVQHLLSMEWLWTCPSEGEQDKRAISLIYARK